MLFAKKAQPLSYAEGPRLERAIKVLAPDQRAQFVAGFYEHLKSPKIQSIQRRGQFLYIAIAEGKEESVNIFDFGGNAGAQCCLTALTDCLRSQGAPVKVLMPVPPQAP